MKKADPMQDKHFLFISFNNTYDCSAIAVGSIEAYSSPTFFAQGLPSGANLTNPLVHFLGAFFFTTLFCVHCVHKMNILKIETMTMEKSVLSDILGVGRDSILKVQALL